MNLSLSLKRFVFFLAVAGLAFQGCKQDPANSVLNDDDNGGYASDASRIELLTDDAISLADQAGIFFNPTYIASAGATVAEDTFLSPRIVNITFGESVPCVCLDGRKRTGTISISYNGEYTDTGSVKTITFDNYIVDGYQLSGSIKVSRVDTTVTGDWYYRVSVEDSILTTNNQYIVWRGTLVRKIIAGANTGTRTDDFFSISGNATLTRPNSHAFTFNINTPIQLSTDYNFAEAGVITVQGASGVRVLNYGNGTMDNQASVNIGVNSYPIALVY